MPGAWLPQQLAPYLLRSRNPGPCAFQPSAAMSFLSHISRRILGNGLEGAASYFDTARALLRTDAQAPVTRHSPNCSRPRLQAEQLPVGTISAEAYTSRAICWRVLAKRLDWRSFAWAPEDDAAGIGTLDLRTLQGYSGQTTGEVSRRPTLAPHPYHFSACDLPPCLQAAVLETWAAAVGLERLPAPIGRTALLSLPCIPSHRPTRPPVLSADAVPYTPCALSSGGLCCSSTRPLSCDGRAHRSIPHRRRAWTPTLGLAYPRSPGVMPRCGVEIRPPSCRYPAYPEADSQAMGGNGEGGRPSHHPAWLPLALQMALTGEECPHPRLAPPASAHP